jgi:hypothetical protein
MTVLDENAVPRRSRWWAERSQLSWLLVAAVLPAAIVFLCNVIVVRNHFYAFGPWLLDAGWLSDVAFRNGVLPLNPPALHRAAHYFFGDDFALIVSLGSGLSYLSSGDRVDWYCVFQGAIFAPLGVAPALLVKRPRRTSLKSAILTAGVAVVFAFSGQVLACAAYPHFEIIIPAGICVMLAGLGRSSGVTAWTGLVLAASGREDGGIQAALFLLAVLACDLTKQPFPVRRRSLLKLIGAALLISVVELVLQKAVFGGDPSLRAFIGEPAYAHLGGGEMLRRVSAFATRGAIVWLPIVLTVVLAVLTRDARLLLGWIVEVPWLVLNLTGRDAGRATFDMYSGFPFVASVFWVGAYVATTPRGVRRWQGFLAAASAASTLGLWFAAPAAFSGTLGAMVLPTPSDGLALRSFAQRIRQQRDAYGSLAIDDGMLAWTIESAPVDTVMLHANRPVPADVGSIAFFQPGLLGAGLIDIVAQGDFSSCGRIPQTRAYFCTRTDRQLPGEFAPASVLLDGLQATPAATRRKSGYRISASPNTGIALFGPFATLSPGRYTVTWEVTREECDPDADSTLRADVAVRGKPLREETSDGTVLHVPFELDATTEGVELRFWSSGCELLVTDARLTVDRVRFPLRYPATSTALSRGKIVEAQGAIAATGEEGTVMFGPYVDLPRGDYTARWTGRGLDSPGELGFDVVARGGVDTLAQWSTTTGVLSRNPHSEIAILEFSIPTGAHAVEARIFSRGGAKVVLEELSLEQR